MTFYPAKLKATIRQACPGVKTTKYYENDEGDRDWMP